MAQRRILGWKKEKDLLYLSDLTSSVLEHLWGGQRKKKRLWGFSRVVIVRSVLFRKVGQVRCWLVQINRTDFDLSFEAQIVSVALELNL